MICKYPKAFTLMEIIIVVVILGILAGIALPKVVGPHERMISSEGMNILTVLLGAQKNYAAEHSNAYAAGDPNTVLDITIPTSTHFDAPTVANANPIASIKRDDGTYTLNIDDDGVIWCAGAGCAAIHCTRGAGSQCN